MQIPVRQRLVGAVVLVALGVIFLPVLFDGAGRDFVNENGPVMPPAPRFEPAVALPPPIDAELAAPREAQPASPAAVAARRESTVTALPDSDARPDPAQQPPRAEAPPRPAALAWVVQIGSFAEEANALAERDRLREAGYSAFVEPYAVEDRTFYRVKVGPELRRQDAEALAAKIESQERVKGIVVTHP